jgi:hypothetical protein
LFPSYIPLPAIVSRETEEILKIEDDWMMNFFWLGSLDRNHPITLKDAADGWFHPYEDYGQLVKAEVNYHLARRENEKPSTESLDR